MRSVYLGWVPSPHLKLLEVFEASSSELVALKKIVLITMILLFLLF